MSKRNSNGSRNRTKGHNAEREYAKIFKNQGYNHCKTSRQASRLLDDSKVDLFGIPFNVQIKAGYPRGLNHANILYDMKNLLQQNFPEEDKVHSYPKLVIHHKNVGRGKRRNEFTQLVTMTFEDFLKIINNNG